MHARHFAEGFRLCTDDATRGHLACLNGTPDGVFVAPPSATTLRVVREPSADEAPHLAQFIDGLRQDYHVEGLAPWGLPECIAVRAKVPGSTPLPIPALSTAADDGKPVGILVDAPCGEAVLRGASVFAPGIFGSTRHYASGDACVVLALVNSPADGSAPLQVLKGSYVTPETIADRAVVVGTDATLTMDRGAVTAGHKGVAVVVGQPAFGRHPPLSGLPAPLDTLLFLQNWSSMAPVALLRPQATHKVLDMCAAPGGKASHLLSSARATVATASDLAAAGFRLVAYDRSKQRCAPMRQLLVAHHGQELVDACVTVEARDANKAAAATGYKFDRILLDPTCSGLGLRPRLRPHDANLAFVLDTADYQRKLLRTAHDVLAPGGRMTYSTCTLAPSENEQNVQWALEHLPGLRLVEVAEADGAAAQLSALARWRHDADFGGKAVCCWTFGPSRDGDAPPCEKSFEAAVRDSVGFFVALFEKAVVPTAEEPTG